MSQNPQKHQILVRIAPQSTFSFSTESAFSLPLSENVNKAPTPETPSDNVPQTSLGKRTVSAPTYVCGTSPRVRRYYRNDDAFEQRIRTNLRFDL